MSKSPRLPQFGFQWNRGHFQNFPFRGGQMIGTNRIYEVDLMGLGLTFGIGWR